MVITARKGIINESDVKELMAKLDKKNKIIEMDINYI